MIITRQDAAICAAMLEIDFKLIYKFLLNYEIDYNYIIS